MKVISMYLRKTKMRLNNNIKAPGSYETAVKIVSIWVHRSRIITYYALGKDKPSSFITSAMQMVAERETPTRQCTSVAVPSNFPRSK